MNVVTNRTSSAKLRARREKIELTLEYLKSERRGVEENADWMDPAAYLRRMDLFDRLAGWYNEETARIEKALDRINAAQDRRCTCLRQAHRD